MKVTLRDDRSLTVKCMGRIIIQRKDGKPTLIEDELFVPSMKCNLENIGQLVEKSFFLTMGK